MPKGDPLSHNDPVLTFLSHFWRCLLDDLRGEGVPTNELPSKLRGLPYREKVRIERERYMQEARQFLTSDDFVWWARLSNFDAGTMRARLLGRSKWRRPSTN